jgi:Xaa-Pro aminopeptidase
MFFNRNEYVDRWQRVQVAMADAGYENVVFWQRSAGTYDKIGDVLWLTNFHTFGTGQEPGNAEYGDPFTFSAVLIRKGQEPELHIGLSPDVFDLSRVVCGKVVSHEPNMMVTFAEYLRAQGVQGRVAVVGDDVLPGMYDRVLRQHSPQIEWVSEEQLLMMPQMVKSPRELEAYRIGGDLVTAGLNAAIEAMIAGKRECEAAGLAAAAIMSGGGGFHRIDINHGAFSDKYLLSRDLYGHGMKAPSPGDVVTVWIYGPLFEGYFMDPGRSAICGNRPTAAQRSLVEDCAQVVDGLVDAVVPGATARDIGRKGEELLRKVGYFDDQATRVFPLLGHGLGVSVPPFLIPLGDVEGGDRGWKSLSEPIKPGMVLGVEAFLNRTGVGHVGFERNLIVTASGAEVLEKTPMLFW